MSAAAPAVVAFDMLSGAVIGTYGSAWRAARELGDDPAMVRQQCRRRCWPRLGMTTYRYEGDYDPGEPYGNGTLPVAMVRLSDMECLAAWPSLAAAARDVHLSRDQIRSRAARGTHVIVPEGTVVFSRPTRMGMLAVGERASGVPR